MVSSSVLDEDDGVMVEEVAVDDAWECTENGDTSDDEVDDDVDEEDDDGGVSGRLCRCCWCMAWRCRMCRCCCCSW